MKYAALIFGLLALMTLSACAPSHDEAKKPDLSYLNQYVGQVYTMATHDLGSGYAVAYSDTDQMFAMVYSLQGETVLLVENPSGYIERVQIGFGTYHLTH